MTSNTYPFLSEDEREETVIERRERERLENTKIENDEHIPLIPNVNKDHRKTIFRIQVYRTDPPYDGYKGALPPTSDLETVGKLFGNGVYDFHAVTQEGKVLRQNKNVKIDLPAEPVAPVETEQNEPRGAPELSLLDWQSKQYEKDSARIENFAQMVVTQTRETSKAALDSVTAQARQSQERDREFFAGLLAQQQTFFQSMFAASEQAHRQHMEQARQDFSHSLQVIQTANERQQNANDPTLLLSVLQQGLALGQGLTGGSEDEDDEVSENPWVAAITAAGDAVKSIAETRKAELLAPKLPANTVPTQVTAPSAPNPNQQSTQIQRKKPLRSPFTKDELADLVTLKRLMSQKNIDFHGTLRNAAKQLVGVDLNGQIAPDVPEPESRAESDSGEPGNTEMDNG